MQPELRDEFVGMSGAGRGGYVALSVAGLEVSL
jgi:hypothetical protein